MPTKGKYKHTPLKTKASRHKDVVHPVIINRQKRVVGELPNFTNANTQPFHSMNEHDWLLILDAEASEFHATAFHAQPEMFKFQQNGKKYRYTPDTWVRRASGETAYQEVKPDEVAMTEAFQERWEMCTEALATKGHSLELILVNEIRREPRYSSIRQLQRARQIWPVAQITLPIDDVLDTGGQLPIGRLCEEFPDPVFTRQIVWNLILRKHLTIDFDVPLTKDSLVRRV